jgi:hypothetical protein
MTAKLLALSAGHPLTAGRFLVLIRVTMRLEVLGQLIKKSIHLIGSQKKATFQPVAKYRKYGRGDQLR